jgi:hypothetical protein
MSSSLMMWQQFSLAILFHVIIFLFINRKSIKKISLYHHQQETQLNQTSYFQISVPNSKLKIAK